MTDTLPPNQPKSPSGEFAADAPFGEIATRILFENERIRVWEMVLEPGDEGPLHRHEHDHVLVQIAGDRMAVVPHRDSNGTYNEYMEADVVPGQYFVVDRGGIERARNIGQKTYHEILIELKDTPGQPAHNKEKNS